MEKKEPITAKHNDVVHSEIFKAFNGTEYSPVAKIMVVVDSDGVVRDSKTYEGFVGAIPGKIQFYTTNDNGKLELCGEFDKAGRLILFRQIWSVTQNPSGIPLNLVLNTDDVGAGASLNMRRSRGTYLDPNRVEKNDSLFNISWFGHDGQSYKETISIEANVIDDVDICKVISEMTFKFLTPDKIKKESFKISHDSTISVNQISGLSSSAVTMNSALKLKTYKTAIERDLELSSPELGYLIYLEGSDSIQAYTKKGWVNLT